MKSKILLFLLTFLPAGLWANNLQITGVTVNNPNTIQFSISWENGWFFSGFNWDAVWVFIKSQSCSGNATWDHTNLSSAAVHSVSGGSGLTVETTTDGSGVFIRRNSNGGGTQSGTVTLTFATPIPTFANVNFNVLGIEMVWVPQGDFFLGDGSTNLSTQSVANFGTGNNVSIPFLVNGESQINMDILRGDKSGDGFITAHNTIPASFPKGWNGFYCMKYEISQQQYVAFLNSLTFFQQSNRMGALPSLPSGSLAMTTAANQNRNSIVIQTPGINFLPVVFNTDLNQDGVFGDGDNIACNFLSWADLLAYLDWAALRPMTELEFEKANRGPLPTVIQEFAWGNSTILVANTNSISGSGTSSEMSTSSGTGLCAVNGGSSTTLGPFRTGFSASPTTVRISAGASYWGIMDLSGNVWEQCISIGYNSAGGRVPATFIFNGTNGNGGLNAAGDNDVATWPIITTPGTSIVRGGNWEYSGQRAQVSDRFYVNSIAENASRTRRTGGRGVRRP